MAFRGLVSRLRYRLTNSQVRQEVWITRLNLTPLRLIEGLSKLQNASWMISWLSTNLRDNMLKVLIATLNSNRSLIQCWDTSITITLKKKMNKRKKVNTFSNIFQSLFLKLNQTESSILPRSKNKNSLILSLLNKSSSDMDQQKKRQIVNQET